ncbi:MAG: ABC transporter permease [Bacilli bacterium]|nr:ABC transporter permease [Bacilli bacterium]
MVSFKKIFGQIYIWLILLLMYLPVLILVAFSFSASEEISASYGQFTFQLYIDLFTGPNSAKILTAVGNTILIALISAIVSTVLGTLGAIGAFYSKKNSRKAYDFVTQIPVVNAEIVLAFSLTVLFVFLGTFVFKQYLFSFWTLLIGHVVLSLPFVYISVKPKLQQMDPSLYEAAIDLGATPAVALRKVTIPAILPGILSGFLLSITLSLDDFVITAFTRGAGLLSGEGTIETLSTYVQGKIKKTSIPVELRALTTILLIAVIAAVVIISVRRYYADNHKKIRRRAF